jgi:hypothetical protein
VQAEKLRLLLMKGPLGGCVVTGDFDAAKLDETLAQCGGILHALDPVLLQQLVVLSSVWWFMLMSITSFKGADVSDQAGRCRQASCGWCR